MFLDNTACNLASVNLRRFFDEDNNTFDVAGFEHTCRLWTVVLEISVLMAQFPSKEVAQLSYDYRTLGLGYANLGSMLMVSGIPYDSEQARGIAGAITAIMTGIAYKTSAEMASFLGTFSKYPENKKHMLKVMHNHRAAAYDATDAYEGLEIKPNGINAKYCPDYLLKAATKAWDDAVQMGEKYGYRNAQTTVIAPTGTIGLVMDCDTTGVEPDFALVKFKKLSGGGYFKIINQSVPQALRNLKYTETQIEEIVNFAKGHATLKGAPFINNETLASKGFQPAEIERLNAAMGSAFEIGFVFNVYTLGEDCLQRLGFTPTQYNDFEWSLLLNGTPNSAFAWTSYSDNIEYSLEAKTMTSGTTIASGYVGGKTAAVQLGDGTFSWSNQLNRTILLFREKVISLHSHQSPIRPLDLQNLI
jgi:ribonucleoside-diphosphate reductase alpha chain